MLVENLGAHWVVQALDFAIRLLVDCGPADGIRDIPRVISNGSGVLRVRPVDQAWDTSQEDSREGHRARLAGGVHVTVIQLKSVQPLAGSLDGDQRLRGLGWSPNPSRRP